jgi:hypothetical protein
MELYVYISVFCICYLNPGIDVVGLFRPNGNAKALDRLRSLYDKTGDADLRTCTDIMTVAALLKVFLRELPDGLIPQKLTAQFVAAQDSETSVWK